MPAGAQQQVVSREKQWSPGPNKPPPPPFALPRHSATSEVCCFESHSHAPEGLLIPISDNGPQSLIIYSCPPVNNKMKHNKTNENYRNRWKGVGKSKPFTPSEVSLPPHHCWPPYDDSHQNHNCLHCCHFLILAAEVFNFEIDLFQGRLSFQQRRREKASALFIKLLIAPQAKASLGGQWDRKVRTELPFRSYYYIMLCRIGHHGPHPDAQHNMDYSMYHLANIIR